MILPDLTPSIWTSKIKNKKIGGKLLPFFDFLLLSIT